METSSKFSNTELVFLTSNLIMSKLFLVYPTAFAALGASASIILAILTSLLGFVFLCITNRLYKKKKDIVNMLAGKRTKALVSVIIIMLFVFNQGIFVRSVAESLKISILPKSPLFFITFIFMAGVLICSHTGLKAIIRAHSFVTPFTLALVVLLLFSSIGNFDFYNIFPIMGNGAGMLAYIPLLVSYFADYLILMLVIPFSSDKTSWKKTALPSYAVSSAMLIVIISLYTLTIPYSSSDTFFIPVYRIAQHINYRGFMARMESIFTIGWMLSYFLTSATYLYITSMLTGRMLGAKSYRPYMYVTAVIIFVISFVPKDTNALTEWSNFVSVPRLITGIILPVLILWRAKMGEGKET